MRRVLVTGGAGFVGAHVVRHALASDPTLEVISLDALTYAGSRARLADVDDDPRHRFVQGDIRDSALVDRLVADVDAVLHLAAETHVDRSIDAPRRFSEVNVTGAGVVFEACRRAGVRRVLHVSTDEVYGPVPAPHSADEERRLAPSSPYAASKAAADLLAGSYAVTYDHPIMVSRPTNTFGVFQHPEKVVPLFVTHRIDGLALPVYGDGRHRRQWLGAEDHAAAQWLLLTEGEPGEVYNVGGGEERSTLELARAVLDRFGGGDEWISHTDDRPGHDVRYAVDGRRLARLGFTPRRGFDEVLDEVVAWYRANEAWWRPLRGLGAARRHGVVS